MAKRGRPRKTPAAEPEVPTAVVPEAEEAPLHVEEPDAPAAVADEPYLAIDPDDQDEPEAPGADDPDPSPEPAPPLPPVPTKCPACGVPLRLIASKAPETIKDEEGNVEVVQVDVGYCGACGTEIARGAEVGHHLSRVSIGDTAKFFHGLKAEDMVGYLPTASAGGIKITNGGRGVRLYTTRGTMIWRIGMKK